MSKGDLSILRAKVMPLLFNFAAEKSKQTMIIVILMIS
jgi:hypothetical protein